METLVLTQGYLPHRVVNWKKAVCLLFDRKVEVVQEYEEVIRSPSIALKMPAVVRLLHGVRHHAKGVKFSRVNVLARDGFACQYCGARAPTKELTFDHVVPRSQGGRTTWENIVTACTRCNEQKGARTPVQAGMALRVAPARPKQVPLVHVHTKLGLGVPDAWKSWMWWRSDAKT